MSDEQKQTRCKNCAFFQDWKTGNGLCTLYIDKLGFVPLVDKEELCEKWSSEKPSNYKKIILDQFCSIPKTIEVDDGAGIHFPHDKYMITVPQERASKNIESPKTTPKTVSDILGKEGL